MLASDFSRLAFQALALAAVFFLFNIVFDLDTVIIVLNGAFSGAMAALGVAYGKLVWFAILGKSPYDSIRQMTFGFALAWVSIGLAVVNSIYLRATGADLSPTILSAAWRYTAIIAAVLQVTAPDFGLGLFHGRSRKVLWIGSVTGVAVALLVITLQVEGVGVELEIEKTANP